MFTKIVDSSNSIRVELEDAFSHNMNFLMPKDPTSGLVLSQGPIVLHIALFITGFFVEFEKDLICKYEYNGVTKQGDLTIPSPANLLLT